MTDKITEAEAKTKVCPWMLLIRHMAKEDISPNCMGSICNMWKWENPWTTGEEEKGDCALKVGWP